LKLFVTIFEGMYFISLVDSVVGFEM
jgi:hypothetical protein